MKFFNFLTGTLLLIVIACLLGGCKKKETTTEEIVAVPDSVIIDTAHVDSVKEVVEVVPSKRADELFDDFVFAFMKNRKFQKQRILFPLSNTVDGEKSTIEANEWTFDRMYSQQDVYTLIFDSMKGEKAAKDTTLRNVVVEELNLENSRTKKYDFNRVHGEWKLTAISDQVMGDSPNSEFYTFYHRFATDSDYRRQHIASALAYSTYDYDDFKTVNKTISPEEFDEVSPELPQTKITNILYGQHYKNSNLRVLSIRGLSDGMECSLVFKKINGEWMLTYLDN